MLKLGYASPLLQFCIAMEQKPHIQIHDITQEPNGDMLIMIGAILAELRAMRNENRQLYQAIDKLLPFLEPGIEEEEMTSLQVMEYLGISERTYFRRKKDGTLKPVEVPGRDRFYKSELFEAYRESIRRGRI